MGTIVDLKNVKKSYGPVTAVNDVSLKISQGEFVVLLGSINRAEDAARVADRIAQAIGEPYELGSNKVNVTTTIGISVYPADGDDFESMMKSADVAMYHAKQAGRNNYQYFTEKMNEQARLKLNQETKIKQAFANNEFVNFYQPIVDANNNTVLSAGKPHAPIVSKSPPTFSGPFVGQASLNDVHKKSAVRVSSNNQGTDKMRA